jgi:ferredoxin
VGTAKVIGRDGLDALLHALHARGRRVLGPRRRDGAIVYDDIDRVDDLPVGWTDEQAPGAYRVVPRDDDALFGYAVGPDSWKRDLFPPRERLSTATRDADGGFRVTEEPVAADPVAFIGVRACELAAIAVQDRVFLRGDHPETGYAQRRSQAFVVAVDCHTPGGTCFCASMGTGPRVPTDTDDPPDVVLSELVDAGPHEFLVRAGTPRGEELVAALGGRDADASDVARADALVDRAAASMGRQLDADGVHDLLLDNLEHPAWDDVAERCLACANCTLTCPTCFCGQLDDTTSIDGSEAYRDRRWGSCFNLVYSHHAGAGPVRSSVSSRYRQWMTHKLATWIDQFGTSGCVGCGRCITWCPVGIDITAQVAAMATDDLTPSEVTG